MLAWVEHTFDVLAKRDLLGLVSVIRIHHMFDEVIDNRVHLTLILERNAPHHAG